MSAVEIQIKERTVRRWFADGRGYNSLKALSIGVATRRIKAEWKAAMDALELTHYSQFVADDFEFTTVPEFDRKKAFKTYLCERYGDEWNGWTEDESGAERPAIGNYLSERDALAKQIFESGRSTTKTEGVE